MTQNKYDLVIKNGTLVVPNEIGLKQQDIAIKNGLIVDISKNIPAEDGDNIFDSAGKMVFDNGEIIGEPKGKYLHRPYKKQD